MCGAERTSYLLISAISSSIWCSAAFVGATVALPCSAIDIAYESRELTLGRCWRDTGTETEEDREFMACFETASFCSAGLGWVEAGGGRWILVVSMKEVEVEGLGRTSAPNTHPRDLRDLVQYRFDACVERYSRSLIALFLTTACTYIRFQLPCAEPPGYSAVQLSSAQIERHRTSSALHRR